LPIVNDYLFSEIFDVLVENKWMNKTQAKALIDFIKQISLVIRESSVYRLSADPKDNYLFDLAIQDSCVDYF